ncbi:flagellar assembly protein FliW [Virgibacillus byunsanensis]|uniref:Flagellar assembly factor FliW n=1 Tax=Virgibacillus byunsanensis TaxID=570945 RepID=A0ABW3LKF4_9BACI
MNIETKYLGEVEIDTSKCITFPNGLPGFVEETKFVLLDLPGNPLFQVLQSTQTSNTAFIVTNPYHFYQAYSFELDDAIIETLNLNDQKDVVVLAIITLRKPFDQSTINLKAPVIINANNGTGKQFILNTDDYPSKASITIEAKGD